MERDWTEVPPRPAIPPLQITFDLAQPLRGAVALHLDAIVRHRRPAAPRYVVSVNGRTAGSYRIEPRPAPELWWPNGGEGDGNLQYFGYATLDILLPASHFAVGANTLEFECVDGFGIFYDEILPKYYFFSGSLNPPFTTRTSIANPPFPNVVANFDPNAPIRAQLQTVNYDLQTPFIMQFNASVQQSLPGDWDRGKAASIASDILTRNPDLVAIFAANDGMALGAVESVYAAGKGDQVTIIGVDGNSDAVKSIKSGRLNASVAQLPYLVGKQAVEQGITETAGVVTSAAIVMVAVFAIFATLSGLDMKQLGVGLSTAILLDATLVRGVLLPATMKLLGEHNWYLPKKLNWLPRVSHGTPAMGR
jgi:hypothetical protein